MPVDAGPDETVFFSINGLPCLNLGCIIYQSNLLKNQRKSSSTGSSEYPGLEEDFQKITKILHWEIKLPTGDRDQIFT